MIYSFSNGVNNANNFDPASEYSENIVFTCKGCLCILLNKIRYCFGVKGVDLYEKIHVLWDKNLQV